MTKYSEFLSQHKKQVCFYQDRQMNVIPSFVSRVKSVFFSINLVTGGKFFNNFTNLK